jgi:uncharacterized repeat protein (TIGR03803 family)
MSKKMLPLALPGLTRWSSTRWHASNVPGFMQMKSHCFTTTFTLALTVLAVGLSVSCAAADLVTREAESAEQLGSDFAVNTGSPTYITITTDSTASNPGSDARVATFSVTFPSAGTYDLYARVRVGPGAANDDSFFYGNGFGVKTPTSDADWILVNSINVGGFENSSDVVSGNGSAGVNVWKWINLSEYTGTAGEPPITFTVNAGNLNQTFQVGAREDGLDMDKFVFGTDGALFTVANLDSGMPPTPPTNAFPLPDGIALHRFSPLNNGINADGANPATGLALSDGVLVGTTLNGGLQGAGTTFYLSLDGTNFNGFNSFANEPDAGNPQGDLVVSGSQLFGTSFGGGNSGVGTVFVGQTSGGVSLIRNFAAVSADNATNAGGASPSALLALSGNTLYGTTTGGGTAANGTVFSVSTNGSAFSVLHNFSAPDSNTGTNTDGAVPWGGLIVSGNTLYGTASAGGAGGNGVVFSVDTSGGNFTTLHNFKPMDPLTATNKDGAVPFGGLVLSNNTLYGTASAGGEGGNGTIFSLDTDGSSFTALHHFAPTDPVTDSNSDGASPVAALTLAGGVLYGTAPAGGSGANGTVFSVNTNGMQFKTLYSFAAVDSSNGTNAYGATPVGGLLLVGNSLYGTTFRGGPGAAGTVFSLPLTTPPSPAIITNAVQNLDGSVTIFFAGVPDSTNIVQATANLALPGAWQTVSTNVADGNGEWQFTESNTTSSPQFYRSYAR